MLAELRQKIDSIDDAIIALLVERTHIVEEVGKFKAANGDCPSFIRPGREASMLRRLMEKISPPFPKAAIAALWRIIIAASLNIEQKLQVAVHIKEGDTTPYWYSREYFGTFTAVARYSTAAQVIHDITNGKANIGVLFLPQGVDTDPWWCDFTPDRQQLYVFARIPFVRAAAEKSSTDTPKLIALSKALPEKTEDDKTLLTLHISTGISQGKVIKLFEQYDLSAEFLATAELNKDVPDKRSYLVEIKGFLMEDHPKIDQLVKTIDKTATVMLLGTYAVPVTV